MSYWDHYLCYMEKKTCSKCHEEKSLNAFHKGNGPKGRRSQCISCCKQYSQKYPALRKKSRDERRKTDPEYRKHEEELQRQRDKKNPAKYLYRMAKYRASQKGLEFTISESDIVVPNQCPLLEVPFDEVRSASSYAPSLDRIRSDQGYVPGNVWVISKRANMLKLDATPDELLTLSKNLQKAWDH